MSESNKRPASKADLAADTHIEKGREAVGSSVSLAIAAPVCVEEVRNLHETDSFYSIHFNICCVIK